LQPPPEVASATPQTPILFIYFFLFFYFIFKFIFIMF